MLCHQQNKKQPKKGLREDLRKRDSKMREHLLITNGQQMASF